MAKRRISASKKRDLGFQLILLAWPVIQFIIFYIFVNLNSFKLAFNFGEVEGGFFFYFSRAFSGTYLNAFGTSAILWLITTVISIPLSLLFAYYIYKRFFGGKLFKFLLFLPSIISASVMIIIFKKFTDYDLKELIHDLNPALPAISITSDQHPYAYAVVIAYYLFLNFGTTTLIYTNGMSGISNEVTEAARLDGVNSFQEFWHIVLPAIFPTLSTFIITSIATMFTNQYFLFTFFSSSLGKLGDGPIGYIIYNEVQGSFLAGEGTASLKFHTMAALGLVSTLFVIPMVFGVKALLKKFGPSDK